MPSYDVYAAYIQCTGCQGTLQSGCGYQCLATYDPALMRRCKCSIHGAKRVMCTGPMLLGMTQVVFEGVPTYPDASRAWAITDKYKVNPLSLPRDMKCTFLPMSAEMVTSQAVAFSPYSTSYSHAYQSVQNAHTPRHCLDARLIAVIWNVRSQGQCCRA